MTSLSGEEENLGKDISELKHMMTNITEKVNGIDLVKFEIHEISKSISFLSTKYDDLLKNWNLQLEENQKLLKRVDSLENVLKEKDIKISKLENKMVQLDQYSRNKNVEIHGVLSANNENCIQIVEQLASELNLDISRDDIDIAHRLPTQSGNRSQPIIAQFISRKKRNLFLQKKRLVVINRNISNVQIGSTIYINENLNKYVKNLLWQTRIRAKQYQWKYVWINNSKILIRKSDDAPIKTISSAEDLNTMIGPIRPDY